MPKLSSCDSFAVKKKYIILGRLRVSSFHLHREPKLVKSASITFIKWSIKNVSHFNINTLLKCSINSSFQNT